MATNPHITYQKCKKCGRETLRAEFECVNAERGWYRHECRRCTNTRVRNWWHSTPELAKARTRRQYLTRRDELLSPAGRTRINNQVRIRVAILRERVYEGYGNHCASCGETEPQFFTVDHVNNDGHLVRRGRGGAGPDLYYNLIRQKFPDSFQLLCFNCNLGKARNGGVCPHRDK